MSISREIRADALALTAIAGTSYLLTATRFVVGGDTGEFATLFAESGVAHPPGYPVYLALQQAMFWMPGASVAHRAARVSGVFGALAVAALYVAARWWGASRAAGLLSALALATSPLFWGLSVRAEVFTLHALTSAVLLAVCAPDAPVRGSRRAIVLGAFVGLALGNHLTVSLLAPALLYGLYLAQREHKGWLRAAGLAAVCALPGLSSYLLLVRWASPDDGRWIWGDPRTLTALARHAVRADYGITRLSVSGGGGGPWAQLEFLASRVALTLHLMPAALGVAAIVALVRRPSALRSGRGALLATLLLAGPIFVTRFNLSTTGIEGAMVERFHLLPALILSLLAAFGWDQFVPKAPSRVGPLCLAGFAMISSAHGLGAVLPLNDPRLQNWAIDVLSTAPPNAVVMASGDGRNFSLLYVQRALGVRRDVVVLNPLLLLLDPYRARIERRLGSRLPRPHDRHLSLIDVSRQIMATGRALYLTDIFSSALVQDLPSWPDGLLVRMAPPGSALLAPQEIESLARARYAQYHRPRPPAPDPWLDSVQGDYARVWLILAAVAERHGASGITARMVAHAREFVPDARAPGASPP